MRVVFAAKPGAGGIFPEALLEEAASILKRGGLVIYPTETFYALGAVPTLPEAVGNVFAAKGRAPGKPLPLIAADAEAARGAVLAWPEAAEKLAGRFWPGPLTLVLPAAHFLPPVLHGGTGKIAVRVSSHPVASLLARFAGGLLVSTSANPSGKPPPDGPEAISEDILARVDGLVEAGVLAGGFPSTVVDVSRLPPTLVRTGRIDWEKICGVLTGK